MFYRFFRRKRLPLTGAPVVRRLKTYSAQSGYVYQYLYAGQRPYSDGEGGAEFCFDVSADRKNYRQVSVFCGNAPIREWQDRHGRQLVSNEWYAIAKMALFQAFDERTPDQMKTAIHVRASDVEAILETLGLD